MKEVLLTEKEMVFLVLLCFKTLPQKGLVEKGKKGKGGKQSKMRCTVALFVAANGSKVCDPIVVWRSKKPRCFKKHLSPTWSPLFRQC